MEGVAERFALHLGQLPHGEVVVDGPVALRAMLRDGEDGVVDIATVELGDRARDDRDGRGRFDWVE